MCVVILNIFNRYYTILYYSRVATLRSRYRLSFSRLEVGTLKRGGLPQPLHLLG